MRSNCCGNCARGLPCGAIVGYPVTRLGGGAPFGRTSTSLPPVRCAGRTAPRYAYPAYSQLGQLVLPSELPGFSIPGLPTTDAPVPGLPDAPPGSPIVTEEQAQQRETSAFERGREAERSDVIKTAIVGAAVSAVVGIVIGRLFR